jgi:hypothetical protein
MAVAPEALEAAGAAAGDSGEAAPWRAISRASAHAPAAARSAAGGVQRAAGAVSSPSAAARTIEKLIWAVAVGLIVLEVAAQATGQTWSFALPAAAGKAKPVKQPYLPLYGGQASAMPGVLPPFSQPSAPGAVPGVAGQNPNAGFVVGPTP